VWQVAWYLLALAVFTVALLIRIRLLPMPLERDEGEYAYAGQLMLQGIAPYQLAYNMKFPGTYIAYALIMSILGQSTIAVHIGLIVVNAATIVLIFLLGRQLIDSTAGLSAAMSYAILSVSPSVLGLAAHATHFVVLPILAGTLLLLHPSQRHAAGRLFTSGLLFGLGLLVKQPAIFFIVFAAGYLFLADIRRHLHFYKIVARGFTFAAGVILPFAVTCILLWTSGVFGKFWFWTIDYARQYGGLVPLGRAPAIFIQSVTEAIGAAWPLWLLAGIGLLTGLFSRKMRPSTLFLLNLFVVSAVAVSAGFYFRPHYFIMVLPAVSLFIGLAMSRLSDFATRRIKVLAVVPLVLFAAAAGVLLFGERELFFEASPIQASRMIYGSNPFIESVRIADYLRGQTSPSDTIAVLGSEPEIYFYTNRHSATGYIYMYGLMEPQRYAAQMQEEMIREIEHTRPKYLVLVAMKFSWLRRPQSEGRIFTWANEYTARNYALDGFVNFTSREADYFFGGTPPSIGNSQDYILIYKRRL
jgi:Dolichyl-phosphate-mannose-protein mannosyltransferase